MKILSLSRAPLSYKAGIPAYCVNLYSNKDFNVKNYSYDINSKLKKKKQTKVSGIEETIFPSQLVRGTIAFSLGYIYAIITNKEKYDVIHLQHPDPLSAISVLISKILRPKIKIIITWHADIYESYLLVSPFLLSLDILIYLLSSKIIFFTPMHLKSSFIDKYDFLKKKTVLIPNCIPFNKEKIEETKTKLLSKKVKNKYLFLSIGRLVKYKGYEYSIKALNELDINFEYYIIGAGPLKKDLKNLIKKLNLDKKVFLLGEISEEEKNKLLSESDIFLFPSISKAEAYGLVQLEAMSYGLPIVNTNLNNGVNYLAPPNIAITCNIKSTKEILNAITLLTNDEQLYKNKCHDSIANLKRFDIKTMRDEFKKLLKKLK